MAGTSRGNRYGQQGGRWVPPGGTANDPNMSDEARRLYWTREMDKIRARTKKAAEENGGPEWPNLAALRRSVRPETMEEWEGYARQARARRDAAAHDLNPTGLNELDIEAIQRCGEETEPWLLGWRQP